MLFSMIFIFLIENIYIESKVEIIKLIEEKNDNPQYDLI